MAPANRATRRPDVADADDAERLPGELGVHDLVASGPVALAGHAVDLDRALHARQHEHQRVLGHRLGVGAGRVDHGDAVPRGRVEVDGVEAHAVAPDDSHVGARVEDHVVATRARAEQDALRLPGQLDDGLRLLVRA